MRRTPAILVVALLLGCGADDERPAAPRAAVEEAAAELPPLPDKIKPKVVAPEAGVAGEDPLDDPATGLAVEKDAPKPRKAASSATQKIELPHGVTGALDKATALPEGVALPPLEAPQPVRQVIEAGNAIARTPYKWGGGHGKFLDDGYDCSGSVSFALYSAGLIEGSRTSGGLMSWGKPGPGKWITIWTHEGHVFMEVAGIRFDTSNNRRTGSRWSNDFRPTKGYVARHPPGL